MKLRVLRVDAFTTVPLAGNGCAVVLDADRLSETQMQTIAREMNVAETSFVLRSSKADVRARYFTPGEEIPLAGHPTIATTIALIETGVLKPVEGQLTFTLELKAGVISVDVTLDEEGAYVATMTQLQPQFLRTYSREGVAASFGLRPDDIRTDGPVQTVSTGTPMLMVPIVSLDALRRAQLRPEHYLVLKRSGDFFGPHLFCTQGATASGQTFARNFSLPPDKPEDPFTGSATGCMGAYLWHYGLIEHPAFVAEQGHWMDRPGRGFVELVGARENIGCVKVGGNAVVVMEGSLSVGG